jgi:DNA-binding transcriptional regulator YiaG
MARQRSRKSERADWPKRSEADQRPVTATGEAGRKQARWKEKLQEFVKERKAGGWQAELKEFAMPKTVSYAHWSLEPYCIGMKLRSLRTQKRLTLSRLAAETGLSTALLSKLETDRMVPTETMRPNFHLMKATLTGALAWAGCSSDSIPSSSRGPSMRWCGCMA